MENSYSLLSLAPSTKDSFGHFWTKLNADPKKTLPRFGLNDADIFI